MTTHVLISGASIAGPVLAHCLLSYGYAVTVVEKAPQLRPGGQAVDIRGPGKEVLRRIDLDTQVRASRTQTQGMSLVDKDNKERAQLRADMFDGDGPIAEIEILRGDLASVLYEATKDRADYLFDDQIVSIEQTQDKAVVLFSSGRRDSFDIVIGADGLHSGVRSLVFGPEQRYVHDLGFLTGLFTVPNHLKLDSWMLGYVEPNCSAGIRSIRNNHEAMAAISIRGDRSDYDHRDVASQKALLRKQTGHMAWEVPWLLDQMDGADDFYFDSCSQVHMPTWSAGRIALLGDAAFCPSPTSGQGTTLAIVGAYILAGELTRADGNHATAFARYETRMRDYVTATQKMGADNAKHLIPQSHFTIWLQQQMFRALPHLPGKSLMMRKTLRTINGIDLPDYRELLLEPRT
ncbi:FAD-dependent monooxygenase [Paenarthrobacter sp. NPDC056912]|uniref:FAD-dependent monooxygenase n=1 Tax=Paenarthrobacter sp. NPDC056912 TaxID=3345965 RepID=UPI00366C7D10